MTPKEKANELFHKFKKEINWIEIDYNIDLYRDAKQCALLVVDEMLNSIVPKDDDERFAFELGGNQFYWEDVKNELLKL